MRKGSLKKPWTREGFWFLGNKTSSIFYENSTIGLQIPFGDMVTDVEPSFNAKDSMLVFCFLL